MLAALASVDEGLADMFIERAFGSPDPDAAEPVVGTLAKDDEVKLKVMATISECRRMLDEEPLQRQSEYWGTPQASSDFKPLFRKLRRCRDPDRANLVALQAARREQSDRVKEKKPANTQSDDVFGGPLI
jgi:cyclin H